MSELLVNVPAEAQIDVPEGAVIKEAGIHDPSVCFLVSGLVREERDDIAPTQVALVMQGDLFNDGILFSEERDEARRSRFVAVTPSVYIKLTPENFSGVSNRLGVLRMLLFGKIRMNVRLKKDLENAIVARADAATSHSTNESNGRDIAALREELQQLRNAREKDQREIARLGAEVDKLQVDQDWIAPSEEAIKLEREAARLREELSDAVLMANVNAAQAERLQSEALMKARDAWAELSRSEQVAGAVTEFSNFVFGILKEAGASPTRAQVDEYRARIQEIHMLFSDEVCAELADDIGSLFDDDPHTAQIFSVGEAFSGNGFHDPDKPPETRRYREEFLSPRSGRAVTPESSLPPPPEEDDD